MVYKGMEMIPAKTLVNRAKSTEWFGTEYTMNIYKGCCHGCIYCDSRSDCYQIDDFDRVRAKENALTLIRNDLRRKAKSGIIATGSMSDPYNPYEKELHLTRHALELINAYGFGVAITTKSPLAARDIDILHDIKAHSPVIAIMTITSAEDTLSKKLEPNTAASSQRFEAVKKLAENGIYCGILLMPVLPFINDTRENILQIASLAKASGARFIYPSFGVTLRSNQRQYFYRQLDMLFPGLKDKYVTQYGNSYSCHSPNAKALYTAFTEACTELGLLFGMKDIIRSYKMGYTDRQISLY